MTFLTERVMCRPRDNENDASSIRRGCCQRIAFAWQSVLVFLEIWVHFLNRYSYVHVALSSESYSDASGKASALLKSNAAVVQILTCILSFFHFTSAIVLSAFAGLVSHILVAGPNSYCHGLLFPTRAGPTLADLALWLHGAACPQLAAQVELLKAEFEHLSPELVAFAAAATALLASRAFLASLDETANTMLYCFLWDGSDGTVHAHVSKSFRAYAEFHGRKLRRT